MVRVMYDCAGMLQPLHFRNAWRTRPETTFWRRLAKLLSRSLVWECQFIELMWPPSCTSSSWNIPFHLPKKKATCKVQEAFGVSNARPVNPAVFPLNQDRSLFNYSLLKYSHLRFYDLCLRNTSSIHTHFDIFSDSLNKKIKKKTINKPSRDVNALFINLYFFISKLKISILFFFSKKEVFSCSQCLRQQ